ncbi:MAG: urocanate hydratase [Deltaproteobacteria bacterium]|nr:urocanate hydratase [Deltaproteobacteria bacterium]
MNPLELAALPPVPTFDPKYRRAPKRISSLSAHDKVLAVENTLRYLPKKFHAELAREFSDELAARGRIYGYRFRPAGAIFAKPVETYSGLCLEGKAFQLMMDNNLDFEIALYPYELVTYGETGQVCQNWMQYRLIQHYLARLTHDSTLVVQSGHPLGLFPSHPRAPRVIITNGLMVGQFDNAADWARAAALGVSNYGQMTAGGWMYIGPQGIVHGTFNTLLIAGRKFLGIKDDLRGKLFVSSGLGGMSGAQGKAVKIAQGVGIIAEVDGSRVQTRLAQGWIDEMAEDPAVAFRRAKEALKNGEGRAIAFQGNIVDLLEWFVKERVTIDLLSDQTSCHAVYDGGYCPKGLSFAERTRLLSEDPKAFRAKVDHSLSAHFTAVQALVTAGAYFFDYGNAFLKAVFDAGRMDVAKNGENTLEGFVFPSYVEDILGPELFDYGYGPFRWVCLSLKDEDLALTDRVAAETILGLRSELRYQDRDNHRWVMEAARHRLVVGSQARILYQDATGRREIALKFNELVRLKKCGPILLGRDHHDTGGTDSPFRETSNIKDGSNITADMAIQSFAGNAARGMSLVALHNGGGTGIGKAINGGFGLVLDGSERIDEIIRDAIPWDVLVGVARRAWAKNPHAIEVAQEVLSTGVVITLPN